MQAMFSSWMESNVKEEGFLDFRAFIEIGYRTYAIRQVKMK